MGGVSELSKFGGLRAGLGNVGRLVLEIGPSLLRTETDPPKKIGVTNMNDGHIPDTTRSNSAIINT